MELEKTDKLHGVAAVPVSGIWAIYEETKGKYFKQKVHFILNMVAEDTEFPGTHPSVNFKFITSADLNEGYVFLNEHSSSPVGIICESDFESSDILDSELSKIRFFDGRES